MNRSNLLTNHHINDSWVETCVIDTVFLDSNAQEHHVYISFEKNKGLGNRIYDFTLAEELTTAIRMTIEKLFEDRLVASHCTWKNDKNGILKNSMIEFSPLIYKPELLDSNNKK